MDKPRVLVICYSFPPVPGIGGRRWAKFSLELLRLDYEVIALGAVNKFGETSEWSQGTQAIPRLYMPLLYPNSLLRNPTHIIQKIRYRIDLLLLKLLTKGNYFDKAIFWGPLLRWRLKRYFQKNPINHIIVTGAPFSLFKHVQPLIKQFKQIKFYADIRDPWTENLSAYGFQTLSAKRKRFEKKVEANVFTDYHKVFTVNEHMTTYFRNLYPNTPSKFYTIPNGFDENELKLNFEEQRDIKRFVFAGSFYDYTHHYISIICKALELHLNKTLPNNIEFVFYGPNSEVVKKLVPQHLLSFFKFGYEKDKSLINKLIYSASYCLLFLSDDINYSLSTKFCEYIAFRKPIVLFSTDGFTSEYVVSNNIGIHISGNQDVEKLVQLFSAHDIMKFPNEFDVSRFSIQSITKDIHLLLSTS